MKVIIKNITIEEDTVKTILFIHNKIYEKEKVLKIINDIIDNVYIQASSCLESYNYVPLV